MENALDPEGTVDHGGYGDYTGTCLLIEHLIMTLGLKEWNWSTRADLHFKKRADRA